MPSASQKSFKPLNPYDPFDRFVLDYADCLSGKNAPGKTSKELRYSFDMQKKRLEQYGVETEVRAESRNLPEERTRMRSWHDRKYEGCLNCKSVFLDRSFRTGNLRKISVKRRELFYRTETNLLAGCPSENEIYNCPSCGAPIRIGQLSDTGCPYCSARFSKSELFPMTTNYYLVEDPSKVGEKLSLKAVLKWSLIGLPFSFLCSIATMSGIEKQVDTEYLVTGLFGVFRLLFSIIAESFHLLLQAVPAVLTSEDLMKTLIIAIIMSPLAGFFCWFLSTFFKLFWKAGQGIIALWTLPSKKKFEKQMKEMFPDYSFEYFTDKVTGLFRMLIFSEHPEDCLVYTGSKLPDSYKEIIHSDFSGAFGFRNMHQSNGLVYATVTSYIDTIRKSGNRMWKERDTVNMTICKAASAEVRLDYSPFKITCRSCGGSFDAVMEKCCPYCRTEYKNDLSDWTVCSMKIKKIRLWKSILGTIAALYLIPLFVMLCILFWPVVLILLFVFYRKKYSSF